MISTVKSRPNHYEMLGLTPSAKTGDILQAFARQMGLFQARPMADAAQVGIADETLRDPAQRKAYDDSLGLNREPRAVAPSAVSFRLSAHFAGSAPVERAERSERVERVAQPAADPVPRPEPEAEPQPRAEAPAERSPGSFIAASLRNSSVPPIPAPSTMEVPERAHIRQVPSSAPTMFRDDAQADADSGPIDWKRPAVAVGGLIAAVALVGAWAGWKAGNDIDPAPPERAVTVALPQAKPASAEPETAAPTVPLQRQQRVRATLGRSVRAPAAEPGLAEQELHANPALSNPPEVNPAEEFAAEAAPVVAASVVAPVSTASAVSAPLSNATIAHTIGRIGYACGRVVSTSAIEGAGAFKVTCSSGDSYRAAPVRGHYRFKRLGSH
jgi:hypothetical protein